MNEVLKDFQQKHIKNIAADIRPGDTVKVHQIIEQGEKEKTQIFEGVVLARKHGKEAGATITVRKVVDGIGVERIFPLHSPLVKQIEVVKKGKTRRAKLYYLREAKGKRARLQTRTVAEKAFEEPETQLQTGEALEKETSEERKETQDRKANETEEKEGKEGKETQKEDGLNAENKEKTSEKE